MNSLPRVTLTSCPKGYTRDLDKAMSPAQTIARVRQRLTASHLDVLSRTRRGGCGPPGHSCFSQRMRRGRPAHHAYP